eukprot:TRINITY_DN49813_c0_g1_i1.p1 TRINITY_DN49813_c0_g1~~TRINITY_DN49813_c0_g1_i1.p1  ORF type:complete len:885 (-),score=176.49 TRINITY_DN49813_c0_g1_i1:148-2640(-)
MDKYGLIGVLGRAFRRRGFAVEEGEWAVKGALFHGSFHLRYLGNMANTNGLHDFGLVKELTTELQPKEHTSINPFSPWGTQNIDISPKELACVQVELRHDFGFDLRVGFLALVRQLGGHATHWKCHSFKSETFSKKKMQLDIFWIDYPHVQVEQLMDSVFASPEVLQKELQKVHSNLEAEEQVLQEVRSSPPREFQEPDGILQKETFFDSTSPAEAEADTLLRALRDSDRRAMNKQILDLPAAVKERVQKTPYKIMHSSWGVQFDGFQKFMGAGIIQDGSQHMGETAPLLQFSSFLIKDRESKPSGSGTVFQGMAALGEVRYSEFVSSIDLNQKRFTIERAFLNKTSPVGRNFGAAAISEHLFSPVWEAALMGLGHGELLLPVEKIKEIKLSDVVNWNTYAIMAVTLADRGEKSETFGVHFDACIDHEFRSVKLSRKDSWKLPLIDVLMHTCLGKLIRNVLELWQKRTFVTLRCTDAAVTFLEGFELVGGERRRAMDITCKVQVESRAPKSPLKTIADQTEPVRQPHQTEEQCLEEWALLIHDWPAQTDYGFQLGQEGTHEVERTRPVLLAVSGALHELQRERGWSCLAVAAKARSSCEELTIQRKLTDACLVEALAKTTSQTVRMVAGCLLLLRAEVDGNIGKELDCMERYEALCAGPRKFNTLIGLLLEWLVRAVKANREIGLAESQKLRLFCYFKEQLGRERALVLCAGYAYANSSKDGATKQAALMATSRTVISGLLEGEDRFRAAFQQLDDAHARFMRKGQPDSSAWFDVMSVCIDLCQKMVEELLGDVRERDSILNSRLSLRTKGADALLKDAQDLDADLYVKL